MLKTGTLLTTLAFSLLMSTANPDPLPKGKAPQNEGLRQELLRRMRADQDARKAVVPWLEKKGAEAEGAKKRLQEIDRENTARMQAIIKQHGWPGKSLVGTDGAHAAWLLVQHADRDRPFQKRCLRLLKVAVEKGEATGEQLAYLTDRVQVGEKKPQVYGTQLRWVDGKLRPQPIEDEANVDRRRKAVGLPPLADYLRLAEQALKQSGKSKP
jgi:hypothetical protein